MGELLTPSHLMVIAAIALYGLTSDRLLGMQRRRKKRGNDQSGQCLELCER